MLSVPAMLGTKGRARSGPLFLTATLRDLYLEADQGTYISWQCLVIVNNSIKVATLLGHGMVDMTRVDNCIRQGCPHTGRGHAVETCTCMLQLFLSFCFHSSLRYTHTLWSTRCTKASKFTQ